MQVSGGPQSRSGQDRTAIALIEVSSHASHVTYVVAHVVGDGGRIARVILGNILLNLADEVGTHIGGFRIDAAAHTCKKSLGRSPHSEGEHRGGDDAKFRGRIDHIIGDSVAQDDVPERDVEQPQPHDDQPHHCSAAESDTQPAVE